MDWAIAGVIGLAMFLIGEAYGYVAGRRDELEAQKVSRRIDELTETRRV